MSDIRKALAGGCELIFDMENRIQIREEIGRGASCIVYHAMRRDSIGLTHAVRIKECFPYRMDLTRRDDGMLVSSEADADAFTAAKERFYHTYIRNVEIKQTLGLINSTSDAANIFQYHNTWYVVMDCVEGTNYRSEVDDSLQSVLIRLRTLSKIIKKYHEHGLLHLDIKPENIYVLPETREHMMLFDFDSMLPADQQERKSEDRMSFSDGFAAPELVRGKRDSLCEATDIYSIGAVLFYKLFGRKPTVMDTSLGSDYDFQTMKYSQEPCHPALYRKLAAFLHRTLSSSIPCRFQHVSDVLENLEELIALSDRESRFIVNSFSYNSSCFVGREKELDAISAHFRQNQVLFLSGIGGIGKTELAKRYAYEHQSDYDSIALASFNDSIADTLCGSDILINRFERDEDESDADFFERKLATLKSVTSKRTLIILDNFDVESDENLERLLECDCKFLITTREDFSDYNYPQTEVAKIQDTAELLALFRAYNPCEYDAGQLEAVEKIMLLVEHHTMTVELIAKYLRITGQDPSELYKRLLEKEGITGTDATAIKQKKDKRLRAESINCHLRILFELSGFSDVERELLGSLSLLGYIRIQKETFLKYCDILGAARGLAGLIRAGWIEQDEKHGKISLHQIILDLVYNSLKPSAENCPHIVAAMTDYMKEKMPNYTELDIRRKLTGYFVQRTSGDDMAYAALLTAYCHNIRNTPEYLETAEKICTGKNADQDSVEALQMRMEINRLKLKNLFESDSVFDYMLEDDDTDKYFDDKASQMVGLAEQSYVCAKQYAESAVSCDMAGESPFDKQTYLANFCVELAYELDSVVAGNMMMWLDEDSEALCRIADYMVFLFDEAESYLFKSQMSAQEKEKLFEWIQEFFSGNDLMATYRGKYYENVDRGLHYQKLLDALRQETEDDESWHFHVNDISYNELAAKAVERGDYEEAVRYYRKELADGDEPAQLTLESLSEIYVRLGEQEKAIACLEQILEVDRKEGYAYSSHVCVKLIGLLADADRDEEAFLRSQELICENHEKADMQDADALAWVICGYYHLSMLAIVDNNDKNEYWQKGMEYYRRLGQAGELPGQLFDFIVSYVDHCETTQERLAILSDAVKRTPLHYDRDVRLDYLERIVQICEAAMPTNDLEVTRQYVDALLRYCQVLGEQISPDYGKILEKCEQARSLYAEKKIENAYLDSLIYKIKSDCLSAVPDSDFDEAMKIKKKCDFYLLAEHDAQGETVEKQTELWKDAAYAYSFVDNREMEEQCHDRIFELLEPQKLDDFDEYFRCFGERIRCLKAQGKTDDIYRLNLTLYKDIITYYHDKCTQKNCDDTVQDWYIMLKDCAGFFQDAGYCREALLVRLLAILVVLGHGDCNVLDDMVALNDMDIGKFFVRFRSAIRGEISMDAVDQVLDIWNVIQEDLGNHGVFADFKRELKWFENQYQHHTIDFKR